MATKAINPADLATLWEHIKDLEPPFQKVVFDLVNLWKGLPLMQAAAPPKLGAGGCDDHCALCQATVDSIVQSLAVAVAMLDCCPDNPVQT